MTTIKELNEILERADRKFCCSVKCVSCGKLRAELKILKDILGLIDKRIKELEIKYHKELEIKRFLINSKRKEFFIIKGEIKALKKLKAKIEGC